jgi:hypothetical protein
MEDIEIVKLLKCCASASGCRTCYFCDSTDCAGEISALALEVIERLTEKMPRWIPVTERMPEKAGDYLCVYDEWEVPCVAIVPWNDEREAFGHEANVYDPDSLGFVDTEFEEWSVTHWMPIPDAPDM